MWINELQYSRRELSRFNNLMNRTERPVYLAPNAPRTYRTKRCNMPVIDTIVSETHDSDNDSYLLKSSNTLRNALDEIRDLQLRLAEAKEFLPQLVVNCLEAAPTRDEADALAWEVYWRFQDISTAPLSQFYRMPISYVRDIIGSASAIVGCKSCATQERQIFTSRTAYKAAIGTSYAGFECDECKEKKSRENEVRKAEFQLEMEARRQRIIELRTMPYREYLQTDHWKEIRMAMLKRAKFSCQLCSAKGELHVHHRSYENRGQEIYGDLIVLCANCHSKFHDKLVG